MRIHLLLCLAFLSPLFVLAQLSVDRAYSDKLKETLSRKVKDVTVKDLSFNNKTVFIDCRESNEYEISHIKNAVWVGFKKFDLKRLKEISKSSEIIVYCTIGYRSEIITHKLKKSGYSNVRSLIGGILEWKNMGNQVFDLKHNTTEFVHTFDESWAIYLKKGTGVW